MEMENESIGMEVFRKIQLDILISVDEFCKKHNIQYFLAYGTLIGALRHRGYIPWDDDIDIAMPRPDYEKFIKSYGKEGNDTYYVLSPDSDKLYPYTFAKICKSGTHITEFSSLKYDLGVNIDLFPIDGLPAGKAEIKSHYSKICFYRDCLNVKRIKLDFKKRSLQKNCTLTLAKVALWPVPYRALINKIVNLSKKYSYSESCFAADLNFGNENRCLPKTIFEQDVPVEFENHRFPAPVGYDRWLRVIYGEYMQLPPLEKQVTHHAMKAYYN